MKHTEPLLSTDTNASDHRFELYRQGIEKRKKFVQYIRSKNSHKHQYKFSLVPIDSARSHQKIRITP